MPKNLENRVLNRMGAHELTAEDAEKIMGSGNNLHTFASHTGTLPLANPDSDFDQ